MFPSYRTCTVCETALLSVRMPATSLCVKDDGIHRCNERTNNSEPVSNFTLKLTGSVSNADSGDSGFLVLIKRVPDGVER